MFVADPTAPSGHSPAFELLTLGVPLSLLLDLAGPVPSSEIYRAEPGDAGWLLAVSA